MKAGWDAFLGIIVLLNSFSGFSASFVSLVSSIILLLDLLVAFFRSMLPLLLVAPLEECSCTFTSDIVGRVGTVGTGVKGVPLILRVLNEVHFIIPIIRGMFAPARDCKNDMQGNHIPFVILEYNFFLINPLKRNNFFSIK